MTTGSYVFSRVSMWGDWILPTLKQIKRWLVTNGTNSCGPGALCGECVHYYRK